MPRRIVFAFGAAIGLSACGPESGLGFRLPDGSQERGRSAFIELRCHACHDIIGINLPELPVTGAAQVTLGGITTRVKTYGELVTSIINPSHKIVARLPPEEVSIDGESLMSLAYLNEVTTVQQLIDLVAFLETTYEVVPPPIQPYWYVYP
jgi:hypothetical protein